MYHWNCVAQRENPLALLNYALLQQYLVKDIPRAERFFHRAISALKDTQDAPDPARPAVIENFELFELERLPGGEFHTPVPSNTVVRNSELVELRRANQFHTSHLAAASHFTPRRASFVRHRRGVRSRAWRVVRTPSPRPRTRVTGRLAHRSRSGPSGASGAAIATRTCSSPSPRFTFG